jgi:hypothetical protein
MSDHATELQKLYPNIAGTWPVRSEPMSVYKKLSQARETFHSLKLTKTGENKFAGYKYFELGDFLIPALQVFREVGLLAYVSFDKEMATMTIVDLESDTKMEIRSPMGSAALKGCHEVQNIGAVETYQRRYLWVAALEIVEHDALDATTGKAGATEDKKPASVIPATFRSSPLIDENGRKAIDLLPDDQQEYLRDLAMEIVSIVIKDGGPAAHRKLTGENLDNEQRMGLWSILDSKTRTALTKARQQVAEAA